jgi:hypothetical protein
MTLANAAGTFIGFVLIAYGALGKGRFYNQVEAPLRREEREIPPRPFTRGSRILYVGTGLIMITLGILQKFSL